MISLTSIIILFVSIITTALLIPIFHGVAIKGSLIKTNYKGEPIPFVGGMVLSTVTGITIGLGLGLRAFPAREGAILLFILITATILGLIDDVLGKADSKGFTGHFKRLFKAGKLTTGSAKAIFGGLSAFVAGYAVAHDNIVIGALNGLLIALMMNTINLLDLRPGRAGKGFIIGFLLLILLARDRSSLPLFLPILSSLIIYLPMDLSAMMMMGDTGSNLLGALLGLFAVLSLLPVIKVILLVGLIWLMFFTERNSLTEVIQESPVLNFIDKIGQTIEQKEMR